MMPVWLRACWNLGIRQAVVKKKSLLQLTFLVAALAVGLFANVITPDFTDASNQSGGTADGGFYYPYQIQSGNETGDASVRLSNSWAANTGTMDDLSGRLLYRRGAEVVDFSASDFNQDHTAGEWLGVDLRPDQNHFHYGDFVIFSRITGVPGADSPLQVPAGETPEPG